MNREAEIKQSRRAANGVLRWRRGAGDDPRSAAADAARTYGPGISPVWEATPSLREMPVANAVLKRDTALRRALALADVIAAALALVLVVTAVGTNGPIQLRVTDVLIAPFVILAAKAIGLYDRDQHVLRKATIDEIPSILYLALIYTLTVWLAEALLLQGFLGRPQVFALALMSFVFLATGRVLGRAAVAAGTPTERCIVVGDVTDAARIAAKLESSSGVNAAVVGHVSLHADDRSVRGPLSTPGELAQLIGAHHAERVIIAPDSHDQDEILQVIRVIKAFGVKVSVLPRLLEVVGSSSSFEDVDGLPLLGVRQYGVTKSSASLKRLMDITGSALGLVLLMPLLLLLAVALKCDSRGPVFFRQRRIGRRGEHFSMIKFRSMVADAETVKRDLRHRNEVEGGLFKITNDPRTTRFGRFLRSSSLDELPQLFNVLGGSMSLVGPRPLVEEEDALIEGWQRRRLALKPGMTGLWQIFGSYRIPMNEMVKIDYLYGANWSIWLDLKILLRTIPYVLGRRGH